MPFNNPLNDGMFSIVPVIFIIMFVLIFAFIIFSAFKGVKTWSNNNSQPVLTVTAKLVSKRTNVSTNMHNDGGVTHNYSTSSTTYFATFQVESGDRMEFHLNGNEYGLLAEGDEGKLTFQGSRYLSFERNIGEYKSDNF